MHAKHQLPLLLDEDRPPERPPRPPEPERTPARSAATKRRSALFVQVLDADVADIVATLGTKAGPPTLLLWVALNRRARECGMPTFTVSRYDLERASGLGHNAVIASSGRLESLGFISVTRRKGLSPFGKPLHETNVISILRGCYGSAKTASPGAKTVLPGAETALPSVISTPVCGEETGPVITKSVKIKKEEDTFCVVESIYGAYPRKVAKAPALKAIAKALQTIAADKLLGLTQQYAAAVVGDDPQYIPFPTTWYNQRRFEDDPSTWRRGGKSSTAVKPSIDKYSHLD